MAILSKTEKENNKMIIADNLVIAHVVNMENFSFKYSSFVELVS